MSTQPPTILGRYRLIEEIGSGGMGVVHLAHDEVLDRDVAIKVLPPGVLASETARIRFRKEALALAKLNHPNIATIHEFGTQGKTDFLVTEFIRGINLDTKIRSGALPESEVISVGLQLLYGLAAAHEQGVIHRDLKPGNLRVTTDGRLKILDFGLAQVIEPDSDLARTATLLTQSQEISGTLPYMAPEQLRGGAADARTDVWAVGAVLYEMATGGRPFEEKIPTALAGEILHTHPAAPRVRNPSLSPRLEAAILKCLDKDPNKRYQSARELGRDLEELRTGTFQISNLHRRGWLMASAVAVTVLFSFAAFWYWTRGRTLPLANSSVRRSVAVLGFKNVSGKPELAWVSTALAEMLTTELAAGEKLRTVPGEKIGQMKIGMSLPEADSFGNETLARIRNSLGSDDVVLGSYIPLGNDQIRLDLQLQDTSAGETVLAFSEKGSTSQLDEIVDQAGAKLRDKLGAGELQPTGVHAVHTSYPRNPEAARLYSEGLDKSRRFDNLSARDLFEKSIAIEPAFPLVHAALSLTWRELGYDQNSRDEGKKALELSTGLSDEDRLTVEAQYYVACKEWSKGAEIYRNLWQRYPDNVEYGLRFAVAQTWGGAPKDAITTLAALRKLPPPLGQDPRIDLNEAIALGPSGLGDFKSSAQAAAMAATKAEALGDRLLAANAKYWDGRSMSDLNHSQQGSAKLIEAQRLYAELGDLGGEALALSMLGYNYNEEGNLDLATQDLQSALKIARQIGQGENTADTLFILAEVYQGQGALEHARQTLEEAISVYRQLGDQPGITQTQGLASSVLLQQLKLREGREGVERTVSLHRQYGRKDALLDFGPTLVYASLALGDVSSAERIAGQTLSETRELGRSPGEALGAVARAYWVEDNLVSARTNYEEALASAKKNESPANVAAWHMQIAGVAADAGRLDEAESLARNAFSEIVKENAPMSELSALTTLADILLRQKKIKEAIQLGARAEALSSKTEDQWALSAYVPVEARIRAVAGKPDMAIRDAETRLAQYEKAACEECQFSTRLALGEIEISTGRSAAGRARLTSLENDARSKRFLLIARRAKELLNLR